MSEGDDDDDAAGDEEVEDECAGALTATIGTAVSGE